MHDALDEGALRRAAWRPDHQLELGPFGLWWLAVPRPTAVPTIASDGQCVLLPSWRICGELVPEFSAFADIIIDFPRDGGTVFYSHVTAFLLARNYDVTNEQALKLLSDAADAMGDEFYFALLEAAETCFSAPLKAALRLIDSLPPVPVRAAVEDAN